MEFKFDANQEYQLEAVEAVISLLESQPRIEAGMMSVIGTPAVSNRIDLDEAALLANLRAAQEARNILPDDNLQVIEQEVETAEGQHTVRFPNFSVEMETGTGKTYVYLRTALELFQRYGMRKFIVVVPSVAIREGVFKTLQITERHFQELFDNVPYRFYIYDSASLSQVRQFALSDSIEFMIMTIDAFNKAANVIRQMTDRLQGETPIYLVQATRPILILDEPQNMESEKSVAALAALNPLFALRYSATHRNPYNLIYRLRPADAYRQGLVKRVEVASVTTEDDFNRPYIQVKSIKTEKKTITAQLAVHKLMKNGTVKETVVTVRPGDSLEDKTERPEYSEFVIDEINPGVGIVLFSNGIELREGEAQGADREAIFASQIRYTIEEHFRKQQRLRDKGIKVLSLFFIDRVANYITEEGKAGLIRRLFNQAFDELKTKPAFEDWRQTDPEQVQAAYFAQGRQGAYEDSTTGAAKKDEAAYDLIMNEKEKLLTFNDKPNGTPVAFIFSHSALREGWDNPNVFQVCTLNQTASEIKKRQEIGRGVRLAVNQEGNRVRDEKINTLTVIANESYERYVSTYQSELEAEYGSEGVAPKPANARKQRTVKLRKERYLSEEFKELWERIKHKTRYSVQIDSGALKQAVVEQLNQTMINPPRVTIRKARVTVDEDDRLVAAQMGRRTALTLERESRLPNLIDIMTHQLEYTSPPVSLSRNTLIDIFSQTIHKAEAITNPQEFAAVAVRIIKDQLAEQLVKGIQYEKIDEWYEMALFELPVEDWDDYLVKAEKSLFDRVHYDSGVEEQFVNGLEARDDVKLFVKLPSWFTVPTPVGDYNPHWAIVMEDRDEFGEARDVLYLVRETKSTTNLNELRPDERRKIECGRKHFGKLGVPYDVITSADELP